MLDAFLTGAAARAEHYEIAAYTGLVSQARALKQREAVDLLQENLKQEKEALKKVETISKRLLKTASATETRRRAVASAGGRADGGSSLRPPRRRACAWIRDRGLGVLFVSIFLATWVGQLVFEWLDYANVAADHGEKAAFWSQGFWARSGSRRSRTGNRSSSSSRRSPSRAHTSSTRARASRATAASASRRSSTSSWSARVSTRPTSSVNCRPSSGGGDERRISSREGGNVYAVPAVRPRHSDGVRRRHDRWSDAGGRAAR